MTKMFEYLGAELMSFFGGLTLHNASDTFMNRSNCSFPSEPCMTCSDVLVCEAEKQGALAVA